MKTEFKGKVEILPLPVALLRDLKRLAAEVARDKKIVIHTVAVGDPKAADEDKLDEAALRHRVVWHWVRGHAGHPENELVDRLANAAIATLEAT